MDQLLKSLKDTKKNTPYKDFETIQFSEKIEFKSVTKDRIDVVFSIGGDGSLLSAIRSMNENQIPILGIHIGNLGFLNQINHIDLEKNLNTFFKSGSYSCKTYNLLSAELNSEIDIDNSLLNAEDFNLISFFSSIC